MHIDADQGTVWSVVAGAALATVGGLVAGQIENRLRRREREQSAALLFGELLSALRLVIRLAVLKEKFYRQKIPTVRLPPTSCAPPIARPRSTTAIGNFCSMSVTRRFARAPTLWSFNWA